MTATVVRDDSETATRLCERTSRLSRTGTLRQGAHRSFDGQRALHPRGAVRVNRAVEDVLAGRQVRGGGRRTAGDRLGLSEDLGALGDRQVVWQRGSVDEP